MSHIAKYTLSITNAEALKHALKSLGCEIFEGKMKNYYGDWITEVDNTSYSRDMIGKKIEFGFSITRNGRQIDRFGIVKDEDGNMNLVGDSYGMGISDREISNIIENAYVNARVDLTVLPMLEAQGFFEDTAQSEVTLKNFGG